MGGPVEKPAFFYARTPPAGRPLTKGRATIYDWPMRPRVSIQTIARFSLVFCAVCSLVIGALAGSLLGQTRNEMNYENFSDFKPNLPTKILDRKGRLITEFSADEKREIIPLSDVSRNLIFALLSREDHDFYKHKGFSVTGFVRAALGVLFRRNLGGGSTITQQVARQLKLNPNERTIKRKIMELWWSFQFERRFTKDEILELYINKIYFGDGYYGVESAAKYFFEHSSREMSLAESAVLVIQLASPIMGKYNPFKNPDQAKARSMDILKAMVKYGYCSMAEARQSWNEYWDGFDYTRIPVGAYFNREDKARYFSEYVRKQLDEMLYGSIDYYKDGLTIRTTLDLDYQAQADRTMTKGIQSANVEFHAASAVRLREADSTYVPVVNALTLLFDLNSLRSADARNKVKAASRYQDQVNQIADAAALLFNLPRLKEISARSYERQKDDSKKTTVEGALITIDNETGHILALVGGSGYSQADQNIRAVQAEVSPGSCFKPLYYSAAIDTRKFTPATLIYDEPIVFYKADGTPYIPLNYKGHWEGPVLLWYGLAKSMNVPSLRILDQIGFDAAIDRAALLLGITDPVEKAATFPRVYPLGLGGGVTVSPQAMARAFATFANQGKEVDTIAITSVEDRDGRILIDAEKDLRLAQKRKGDGLQLISPQTAYVMVDLLGRVTRSPGTLAYAMNEGKRFTYLDASGAKYTIPAGGKTGTTQNWADAWTVGFTPYVTTAIWFGFDMPGNSLGINQSGAAIAGSAWSDYMYDIHRGRPYRDFQKPQTGIIEVTVCAKSGQLLTDKCVDGSLKLLFLEGTQPTEFCALHAFSSVRDQTGIGIIQDAGSLLGSDNLAPAASGDSQGGLLRLDQSIFGEAASPPPGSLLD
jgi:penicillin-binding protein 1A